MDNGLFLIGRVRSVKRVHIKPEDGAEFDQLQVAVDTGLSDWIDRVCVRKELEPLFKGLADRKGELVGIRVTVGNFRRLWADELVDVEQ